MPGRGREGKGKEEGKERGKGKEGRMKGGEEGGEGKGGGQMPGNEQRKGWICRTGERERVCRAKDERGMYRLKVFDAFVSKSKLTIRGMNKVRKLNERNA